LAAELVDQVLCIATVNNAGTPPSRARREGARERRDELQEVPVHRLLVAALEQDLVRVAKHKRANPVLLRLVSELPPSGSVSAALESMGAYTDEKRRGMRRC
jgi:hypothetical protein